VEDKYESLVERNNEIYRKIVIEQNRIIGCILLGDLRGSREIQYAIERKTDIGDFKNRLLTMDFDYKRLLG
jgi:nitrite reductase (NADH) large subunit